MGFRGFWRFLAVIWHLDLDLDRVNGLWYTHSEFWLFILILKVSRSFQFWRGASEVSGGSWLGFGILILIWIWSLVFDTAMVWMLALLIFNVQRKSMSFKSAFGALEVFRGSCLVIWSLILIWRESLVFDTPMFQILALFLDFEGERNIHVL